MASRWRGSGRAKVGDRGVPRQVVEVGREWWSWRAGKDNQGGQEGGMEAEIVWAAGGAIDAGRER